VPLTFWGAHEVWPALGEIYSAIYPAEAITTLHVLRLAHVLVLGWLFAALLAPVASRLSGGVLAPVLMVGQQSLITFIAGIFFSALAGVALDLAGRGGFTTAVANLGGFILLIGVAFLARTVKTQLRPTPAYRSLPT
jgi:OpgC protein